MLGLFADWSVAGSTVNITDYSNLISITEVCPGRIVWSKQTDNLAPQSNVDYLWRFFPNAVIERRVTSPTDLGVSHIGHSGFFRETFKDTLWRDTADWIE